MFQFYFILFIITINLIVIKLITDSKLIQNSVNVDNQITRFYKSNIFFKQ